MRFRRCHTDLFFSPLVLPDARFVASSSSTYYSDKRQIAATQFWHFWYNQTLFSNRPNDPWSSYPRGGFGFESTPTIVWSYRTDSQFSVEESAATPVYVQTSYGKTGFSSNTTNYHHQNNNNNGSRSIFQLIESRALPMDKAGKLSTEKRSTKIFDLHQSQIILAGSGLRVIKQPYKRAWPRSKPRPSR